MIKAWTNAFVFRNLNLKVSFEPCHPCDRAKYVQDIEIPRERILLTSHSPKFLIIIEAVGPIDKLDCSEHGYFKGDLGFKAR